MIDVVIAPFYADICNNVRMLHSSEIAFSDCHLNPDSRELTRTGKSIPIEPKTLDLLIYLINNRDRARRLERLPISSASICC